MRNFLAKWERDYLFHQKTRLLQILQLSKEYCNRTQNHETTLLDVGCGSGILTEMIKQSNPDLTIFGIEIDQVIIKLANIRKIPVILSDATKIPFTDKTFDFILCSEVIEHLDHPSKLLIEIKRLLKQNGLILITTPNRLRWKKRIDDKKDFFLTNCFLNKLMRFFMSPFYDFDFRVRQKKERTINPPWSDKKFHTHKKEYTLNEFCKLLTNQKLKILEIRSASETSHYAFITFINNILARKLSLDDFFIIVAY